MTAPAPQVRGTAFLGVLAYIRESSGSDALRRIVEGGGTATKSVFGERIRKLGWYPYDAYAGFLRAADAELGTGDLAFCKTLGSEASRRDLSTVFAFFTRLYGPERLTRACTRVWDQYYKDAGHMSAIAWERERTVVRIAGFPRMDPAHCRLMEGWMWHAMSLVGGQIIEGTETLCTSRGGPYHEFVCRWA